nr:CTP synthase [Candidatus Eremiobacteraeota bacterium]
VVQNADAGTIYQVPLNLEAEGLARAAIAKLRLPERRPQLEQWQSIVDRIMEPKRHVTIAVIGKYVELKDAYISITEALHHSGIFHNAKIDIQRIDSEKIENEGVGLLRDADGVLVAPGFGARGVKGKLGAIAYAREHRVPFLGICYGMQLACVEFARNVCGLPDAMTSEVDETTRDPVIDFLPEQRNLVAMGGTMRLGAYACTLQQGSLAAEAYGEINISERHRHRYEFNNRYAPLFEEHGMRFTGHHIVDKATLVEIIELRTDMHPWFVATQAHPEFKSRPNRAAPLYRDFVGATLRAERSSHGRELASPLSI